MAANEAIPERPAEVIKAARAVERAMTGLLKLLGHEQEDVRLGALEETDAMGIAAIGYLAMGLTISKDAGYRLRLIEALAGLAPLSRAAVVEVLGLVAMRDTDKAVRLAAARAIWAVQPRRRPGPESAPAEA